MRIRRPRKEDSDKIEKIANRYEFVLPNKFHSAAVIEENNEVIAFGMIRLILDAIMVVENGSKRDIVESLNLLMQCAVIDAVNLGHNEVHVFVRDRKFADILKKHFKFEEVEGISLFLKLGENDGQQRS